MLVRSPSDVSVLIVLFLEMVGTDMGPFQLVFGLPPDVVAATLGDVGIEEVVSLATGVSPTHSILASLPDTITSYFSRSRTALQSVSTVASRNATSRGAIRPRPSSNPESLETLSPKAKDQTLGR